MNLDGIDVFVKVVQMGSFTAAAKALQMGPQELFRRLSAERWIFRHTKHSNWSAYQRVVDAGLMAHKLVSAANGRQFSQAMLTVKGMARLAQMLEERISP